MKLVAIADLHYEDESRERVEAVARAVCETDADVLVIAGDCTAQGVGRLPEVLSLFEGFDGHRLMVPGNHDLWEDELPFDTWRVYEEEIPGIAHRCGFHCLDGGPMVMNGTGFVGTMGWYDYGMRQTTPPLDEMTVAPIEVARGEDQEVDFRAVSGAEEKGWEALEERDYAANGLIWQTDERPHIAVWNDALHLDWGIDAPEVASILVERLRKHLTEVAEASDRVVGVTHFVPFAELGNQDFERPGRAFARAYLGSALLGEALMEAPNLDLVIYGHRHRQQVREVNGVVTADAAINSNDGPLLLTLPD